MEEQKNNPDMEELQKKCDEYLNGWKRAKADFINYQKDEAKRTIAILQFANEQLLKELLVVLDSFNFAGLPSQVGGERGGLEIIHTQLADILKKSGLEKIAVVVGDVFNPAMHEAISSIEGSASNTIAEILAVGYTLHGKIIRPAKVVVVK